MTDTATPETGPVDAPASMDDIIAEIAAGDESSDELEAVTEELVSLAYNIGLSALARSTVLRLHRAGDYAGAAKAFAMWNKAGGRVLAGLTRRRAAEAELYRS